MGASESVKTLGMGDRGRHVPPNFIFQEINWSEYEQSKCPPHETRASQISRFFLPRTLDILFQSYHQLLTNPISKNRASFAALFV
jgi:hypothetical protein